MAEHDTLTLHHDSFWISPYVFTVYVALREKGLPFARRAVALDRKEQHGADYQKGSLTGRVPAIEHDGFWLAESSAIAEYLDEVFPAPALLPGTPRERARARQVMAWIRSDLMALREERPTHTMFYERASRPLTTEGQAAADKLVRLADALIAPGRTSLFGSYSIADSDLAFMLHRLLLNGHEVPGKVRAFAEAQWARPAVQEFVQMKRLPYVPY